MREKVLLKFNQYALTRFPLMLSHKLLERLTIASLKLIPNIISIYSMRKISSHKIYGITDLDLALVIQPTKENDPFNTFKSYSTHLNFIKLIFKLLDKNGTIIIAKEDFEFMQELNLGFYWSEELLMKDWTLLWGSELRTEQLPKKSEIGPDTVWRIQSLFKYLNLPHGRKVEKQIEKTNQFIGSMIRPTPYGLYGALESWSAGDECPELNKLHTLKKNPLSITEDQYFVVPSNLSDEAFESIYSKWLELSANSPSRIFFMGNKFFIKFLSNFSHYVAFEPYLLSCQLSIKTELNSKFWRSLIQDVIMEKNERLLRDCHNDQYQNQHFYNAKYKKLTTYLYLLKHRAFPEQELNIPTHTDPQERFAVIYNTINQCLSHIKSGEYETF